MSKAIIYGLRSKSSKLYFYIGSTKFSKSYRLDQHINDIKKNRNNNHHFCNKALKIGLQNIVSDVLVTCSESNRWQTEDNWINYFLALGHPLTNHYHNSEFVSVSKVKSPYENYEVTLEHFEGMLRALSGGFKPNGDEVHDGLLKVLVSLSEHLLNNHPDKLLDSISELSNEQTHRQATSLHKRILAMLECD